MSLIADVSAAEAAVRDLIDLDVATHDPSVSPQLKRQLTLMTNGTYDPRRLHHTWDATPPKETIPLAG